MEKKTKRIDVARAREAAIAYCIATGLSVEKFLADKRYGCNEKCFFYRFPKEDIDGQGLYVDMETQGVVVLIVNEDYTVEETEHTRKYLLP